MDLSPREKDKLLIFTAGLVAERRLARGVKLNYPEAMAYISAALLEGARDGRSVADLISHGSTILTTDDVLPGIAAMMEGRYAGKVVIFPQIHDLPLLALSELKAHYPAVAAKLAPGNVWTKEAEQALIEELWRA